MVNCMKLKDKLAIIKGPRAGLGEFTALLFAKKGVKLICNSVTDSANYN